MPQGTTTVDFGAFPGGPSASRAVTGQTAIQASSLVEAWIYPVATADHSVDEHIVDPPRVVAATIVAGTGFTIYGYATAPGGSTYPTTYGLWNVAWAWN